MRIQKLMDLIGKYREDSGPGEEPAAAEDPAAAGAPAGNAAAGAEEEDNFTL